MTDDQLAELAGTAEATLELVQEVRLQREVIHRLRSTLADVINELEVNLPAGGWSWLVRERIAKWRCLTDGYNRGESR